MCNSGRESRSAVMLVGAEAHSNGEPILICCSWNLTIHTYAQHGNQSEGWRIPREFRENI